MILFDQIFSGGGDGRIAQGHIPVTGVEQEKQDQQIQNPGQQRYGPQRAGADTHIQSGQRYNHPTV